MELPKIGETYSTERLGIAAVQAYAAMRKQIWRETSTGDIGIDGQFEFVNSSGFATGRLIAVQVKAGASYFDHPTSDGWKYYPKESHRNYWESFPLPVLLLLHDPVSGTTFWTDARQAMRTPREESAFIVVPTANQLELTEPIVLFENAGIQSQPFISNLENVLQELIKTLSGNGRFPVSYFELFVHGLTNLCRSIYYGMDAVWNIAEFNLEAANSPLGVDCGEQDQHFVFGFVKFLVAQNLAQIDYSDCLIDWVDRGMQPTFVAPLTRRGRRLVELIHSVEEGLVLNGKITPGNGLHVAQEGFVGMVLESYERRFPRIRNFQAALEP